MPPRRLTAAFRPIFPLTKCQFIPHARPSSIYQRPVHSQLRRALLPLSASSKEVPPQRQYATKTTADEKIEEITEIYATAKDEFEIASEETDKKSVYAADDRVAAREELEKLKQAYGDAIQGENGEEVRRRVGGRVRELERGVEGLEERAMED